MRARIEWLLLALLCLLLPGPGLAQPGGGVGPGAPAAETPDTDTSRSPGRRPRPGGPDSATANPREVPRLAAPPSSAPSRPAPHPALRPGAAQDPSRPPPARVEGSLLGRAPAALPPPRPAADRETGHEPREILLLSENPESAEALRRALAEEDIRLRSRRVLRWLGLVLSRFVLPQDASVPEDLAALRARYPGLMVDANHRYRLQGGDLRQYGRRLTGLGKAGAGCGKGVRVGLLDTGVDANHPALSARPPVQRSFLVAGETPAVADHGTAIAVLLGGRPDSALPGLVPGADLYVAAVFRESARGVETDTRRLLLALDWLAGERVRLLNLSLAGPRNRLLERVLKQLMEDGVLVTAAAGNGGPDAAPAYPAAIDGVLAVTAVDADMRSWHQANRGDYIDFAAPGVDLWMARAGGGARFVSGTSFAVPYVTAALVRALAAGLSPERARRGLLETARDLGAPGPDPIHGHGLVQLLAACKSP